MLGAKYGGHLYTGPGRVISEQPGHPIVKHWGPRSTTTTSSIVRTSSPATESTCYCASRRRARPQPIFPPMATSRCVNEDYGPGRVVYSSLSHSTEHWDIRNVQLMMLEAIKWSLGLSEAPVRPHPKR